MKIHSLLRQLFSRRKLPKRWMAIPSFVAVVEISDPGSVETRQSLENARQLREALLGICHKMKYDAVFDAFNTKRKEKMPLSTKESQYLEQADINYLEMVVEKMNIGVLYNGDYGALDSNERAILTEFRMTTPGSSVFSDSDALRGRRCFSVPRDPRLSYEHAERIILKWIT